MHKARFEPTTETILLFYFKINFTVLRCSRSVWEKTLKQGNYLVYGQMIYLTASRFSNNMYTKQW